MDIKFLYLTDVHIKGINPGKRKDVYYLAILKKLMEIEQVVKNKGINFVVIGGDLFDLPKVSNQLLGEVAKIMKSWGVRIFVVPGNHDVYGQTITTLPHTSLGILERTGVVRILTRESSPVYVGRANDANLPLISFTGQEYYAEIDSGINNDYEVESTKGDVNILVAHSMLLEKPFHPDIHHTLIKDVNTSADIILTGHYHPDVFDHVVKNVMSNTGETKFAKPRSAGRLEATKHNINHKPQYAIVTISKDSNKVDTSITFHDFDWAEDGNKIFDYETGIEQRLYKSTLTAFKEKIQSVDLTHTVDLPTMVREIAQAEPNVSFEHTQLALNYLLLAEKTENKKALDGYVALPYDIQIAKVVLINFQSHEFTEVEFTKDNLNAIVGESDNGKTAILRAIEWVLYNEPKGTGFIREGAKFAEVSIHMTNGNVITRRRTNSDSGHYEVYDAATHHTERYNKFGNSIPIEVFNAHQMPKVQVGKDFESFNIAKQLDGPFMLSRSGAEKAAIIGKITKTDVVDDAIASASKDISNAQRGIKSLESEVNKLGLELEKYNYLDEEEKVIKIAEIIVDEWKVANDRAIELNNISSSLNEIANGINVASNIISQYSNIEEVSTMIAEIESNAKQCMELVTLLTSLKALDQSIKTEQNVINSKVNYEDVAKIIVECENGINHFNQLSNLYSEITKVNTSLEKGADYIKNIKQYDDDSIAEIEKEIKLLHELQENKNAYYYYKEQEAKCSIAIDQEVHHISKLNKKIEELKSSYEEQFREQGTCPVCGHDISSDFCCDL